MTPTAFLTSDPPKNLEFTISDLDGSNANVLQVPTKTDIRGDSSDICISFIPVKGRPRQMMIVLAPEVPGENKMARSIAVCVIVGLEIAEAVLLTAGVGAAAGAVGVGEVATALIGKAVSAVIEIPAIIDSAADLVQSFKDLLESLEKDNDQGIAHALWKLFESYFSWGVKVLSTIVGVDDALKFLGGLAPKLAKLFEPVEALFRNLNLVGFQKDFAKVVVERKIWSAVDDFKKEALNALEPNRSRSTTLRTSTTRLLPAATPVRKSSASNSSSKPASKSPVTPKSTPKPAPKPAPKPKPSAARV
ncbi:hypothetical protein TWF718_006337 [Orbilia javanica]|uniref:Uncharacterized protein n=1 Tax=Orbilia javanica TaxID=47235 RepID=A0AAN8RJV2_9PEZI